jgi:outer membrane protein TolC
MTKSVRSQWLPDVALYANYNFLEQYSDNPPPGNGHYQGMLYGIQLSLPLYEGGQTIAKIQAAQETEASQQLALREAKENWMNDVANASASLEQAIALAELEQGNAAIADSLQGQALKRFEMGALSGIELRKIQTATFDAQERLVLALFSAKTAEIELKLLFP